MQSNKPHEELFGSLVSILLLGGVVLRARLVDANDYELTVSIPRSQVAGVERHFIAEYLIQQTPDGPPVIEGEEPAPQGKRESWTPEKRAAVSQRAKEYWAKRRAERESLLKQPKVRRRKRP